MKCQANCTDVSWGVTKASTCRGKGDKKGTSMIRPLFCHRHFVLYFDCCRKEKNAKIAMWDHDQILRRHPRIHH